MELNEQQESNRDKACELLLPFCKDEEIERYPVCFRLKNCDGDDVGETTCRNKKCIEAEKKNIRSYIGKGKHLYEVCYSNDGDHNNFELCCICGKHLNEFLSWIDSKIEHFETYPVKTVEDIEINSFCLHGILYSTHWSVDKDYNNNLAERVDNLSKSIIKILTTAHNRA